MRIGIDARLYGIADRGIGRYTEKLIQYLEKNDFENEYFIFLRQNGFNQYQPKNRNFYKVLADYRPYTLKEQIVFPLKLYQYKLDLIHFPHFNVPIFYWKTFIVTIHDLIISKFPQSRRKATTLSPILYKIKLFFYYLVIKSAVSRAKKIIAVSEATKKDIIKILKINPEKIIVIYEGVGLPKISKKIQNSKFKIQNSYILYVGAAYPHKNLESLLIAFKELIKDGIKNIKLVLVGKKDYFYQRLEKYALEIDLKNEVIFTGEVTDEELIALYQNALFFIFPSLEEGFGLPGIEAMAYGLPVAASSISPLLEIFGQAAYYFDPYNIKEIKNTMIKLITDENLRKTLKEKGLKQIKKYSWQKMAKKIFFLYKEIIL